MLDRIKSAKDECGKQFYSFRKRMDIKKADND